jgi:hypothetical protein
VVSSGRPEAWRGSEAVILALFADSEMVTANSSALPAPSTCSGAAEFGFTVMTGVPEVTLACTLKLPANTLCVVTGAPPSPAWTSTASVIRPEPVLTARRAATSLPSPPEGSSTAAGEVFSTSWASASALGATR